MMKGRKRVCDGTGRGEAMKRAAVIVKRLVLGAFVAAAVVCGGSKHPQGAPTSLQGEGAAFVRATSTSPCQRGADKGRALPLSAETVAANWNRRGAWRDAMRFDFADGWVFPWGSNHLAGIEVVSWGEVWPAWNDTNAIARLSVPVSIVPGLTTFAYDLTPSNSYRFAWTDAAANRDTNTLITASIELFRNGDWCVTTNGAARWGQRALPFPHDGYGQDAEWVAANFTNAAEILQQGYAAWVDAQVGEGLTNGLYKLTVGVTEDPPETTLVTVGDYSVAVTHAGEYVFLLEKGPDYDITVFPPNTNITLTAADDVPVARSRPRRAAATWGGGQWIANGGAFGTTYWPGLATGRVWWLPWLCGSPDVPHLHPDGSGVTLEAVLSDFCGGGASFHWAASPGLALSTPDARTTGLTATNAPSWAAAHLSVTATFGGGHALYSYTDGLTYGTNDAPQVHLSLDVPEGLVRGGARRTVTAAFASDAPTNGVVTLRCVGGAARVTAWDAAAGGGGLPLGGSWDAAGFTNRTFHLQGDAASAAMGDVAFELSFAAADGTTNAVTRRTTVVDFTSEPITTETTPLGGRTHSHNPCAVSTAESAYFWFQVWPNDVPQSRIVWAARAGEAAFPDGDTGSEIEIRGVSGPLVLKPSILGAEDDDLEFHADVIQE